MNCLHCDHVTWQDYSGNTKSTSYRCCHCGRDRTETRQERQSYAWTDSRQGHGIYYPTTTVRMS
jgi:hypothetical protein